ncbi:hypothetical protein HMPREF6123_2125 [Oribacterium sinus F0268]|uniref:Uncharacterized protein n=1 Tax=Oribacterium sinus F0268 TaxID=585501 RepID=C2L056_9FIRM|nr:hypothetical protein HMPREF6123_2125 [Oribacterium sinus F0268]
MFCSIVHFFSSIQHLQQGKLLRIDFIKKMAEGTDWILSCPTFSSASYLIFFMLSGENMSLSLSFIL